MRKRREQMDNAQGVVGPSTVHRHAKFYVFNPPNAKRQIPNVRMRHELLRVTRATHSFQATPLRARNCPG